MNTHTSENDKSLSFNITDIWNKRTSAIFRAQRQTGEVPIEISNSSRQWYVKLLTWKRYLWEPFLFHIVTLHDVIHKECQRIDKKSAIYTNGIIYDMKAVLHLNISLTWYIVCCVIFFWMTSVKSRLLDRFINLMIAHSITLRYGILSSKNIIMKMLQIWKVFIF